MPADRCPAPPDRTLPDRALPDHTPSDPGLAQGPQPATTRPPARRGRGLRAAAAWLSTLGLALSLVGCAGTGGGSPGPLSGVPRPAAPPPAPIAPERLQRLVALSVAEWQRWGGLEVRIPAADRLPCLWLPQAPAAVEGVPQPGDGEAPAVTPAAAPATGPAPDVARCVRVDDGCGQEQSSALCGRVDDFWRAVPPFRARHRCAAPDRCRVRWPDDGPLSPMEQQAAYDAGLTADPPPRAPYTPPWSAAFVSAMFRAAGFSEAEFAGDEAHARYLAAARDGEATAYEVLPLPATAQAGDLVCALRGAADLGQGAAAVQAISGGYPGTPMHCDIVVGQEPAAPGHGPILLAIGGNVQQTVARSRIELAADGRLTEGLNPHVRWVAVMRARRAAVPTAGPDPTAP